MKIKITGKISIIITALILVLAVPLIALFHQVMSQVPSAYAQNFYSTGGKQIFEAESGDMSGDGWVVFQSKNCSSQRVLSAMNNFAGSVTYSFQSDNVVNAEMSLKMSYTGNAVCMQDVLSVTVNGNPVNLSQSAVYHTCSDYNTFFEFPIGTVQVQSGINTVTITNVGGRYSLDYFAINPISNYTSKPLIIEAENSTVVGSAYPQERVGASGGKVLDNRTDGKIIFTVNSYNPALTSLKLRLGYSSTLNGTNLSNICSISVNGRSLANEIALEKNYSKEVDFYEYTAGNIFLRTGENKIVIENYNNGVFYDCIVLTESIETVFNGSSLTINAENAACAGGNRVQYANDDVVIAFNSATSSSHFLVYSDISRLATLTLDLAYWGTCDTLGEVLFVTVNGYLLDLSEVTVMASELTTNDRYYDFKLYSLGNITFESGYNLITVTAINSEYNVRSLIVNK